MLLREWLNLNSNNINLLKQSVNKSSSTIKSYAYGYRKVPDKLLLKIKETCDGYVSREELLSVYENYWSRRKQYALVCIDKNRQSKPLIQIDFDASEELRKKFSNTVLEVMLDESSNHKF